MEVITEVGLVGAGVRFQTPGSRRLRVSATRVVQPLIPGGDIDGRCALIFILFYILNGVFVVERGIGGCNVWSFGLYVVWLCLCFVYM